MIANEIARCDPFGQSANAPADVPLPARATADAIRARAGFREASHFTPPGECLLAGISETATAREMARFGGWLAALGGVVLVLGLAGGAWLAARAIAPIDDSSAAAARNRDTGGTGLGLSICKATADVHRGTLEVTSAEGGGSTFTLRLPAAAVI